MVDITHECVVRRRGPQVMIDEVSLITSLENLCDVICPAPRRDVGRIAGPVRFLPCRCGRRRSGRRRYRLRRDADGGRPEHADGEPRKGYAELRLERATLRLTWKVTYQGLTSRITAAGLYGPENVGATAGQVVNLGVKGLGSPIQGSQVLDDGVLQYLVTGRVYVNLHTTRYPDGELRGQLRRQRPQATPKASS